MCNHKANGDPVIDILVSDSADADFMTPVKPPPTMVGTSFSAFVPKVVCHTGLLFAANIASLRFADETFPRVAGLELRAAVRAARLAHRHGRIDEARDILDPVLRRITEGFETPDHVEAVAIVDGLRAASGGT